MVQVAQYGGVPRRTTRLVAPVGAAPFSRPKTRHRYSMVSSKRYAPESKRPCQLLTQSGHRVLHCTGPLSEAKRTSALHHRHRRIGSARMVQEVEARSYSISILKRSSRKPPKQITVSTSTKTSDISLASLSALNSAEKRARSRRCGLRRARRCQR